MPAAYDTYDYPSYWKGREYEHSSEIIAIKEFLAKIPRIHKVLDLGCGYARLTPSYRFRADKLTLVDPSSKLLKIAKKRFNNKNTRFIQAKIENITKKIKSGSMDLVIFVRVLHHIEDIDKVFESINRLLSKNGYLILEFANKRHFKALTQELFKGNFTFLLDIFPKDIRSKVAIRKKTLPFINYHPDKIKEILTSHGFRIIETRSVSNIRSPFLKRVIPLETLLDLEKKLQKPLAKVLFGPSVFVLSQKIG